MFGAMIGLYTLGEPRWKKRTTEVCIHKLSIRVIGCKIGSVVYEVQLLKLKWRSDLPSFGGFFIDCISFLRES